MLLLLDQDISQLVQEAEPIREIYKQIRGQLPAEVKGKLHPVTYIESYQRCVEHAQNRLEERICQGRFAQKRQTLDSQVADQDSMIQVLSNSCPEIIANVDRMKRRRVDLLKELR